MIIGRHDVAERIFVVAEIGNNHEGSFATAQELVRRAASTGVDAVKLQTFRARWFTSAADPVRFARLQSFELAPEQFAELAALARSLGLGFFSTPLDLESARVLEPLVDAYKIASGDNDFYPLIAAACRTGKPLIVSSGLADLEHLEKVRRFVYEEWQRLGVSQDLAILHCACSYPVPPEEANLAAIPLLRERIGCEIGYSDHTLGPTACITAAALGARIIEKHFTLDKDRQGFRDHQLSADPPEMRHIVEQVRRVELLLGRPEKRVMPCELPNRSAARRAICAAADLPAGHALTPGDLTWLRPAVGLSPGEELRVVGRRLVRAVRFGEPLLAVDVE